MSSSVISMKITEEVQEIKSTDKDNYINTSNDDNKKHNKKNIILVLI